MGYIRGEGVDMKMKVLVFDPVGGASGDMILASLVQLGCPVEYLKDAIISGLEPFLGKVDMHVTDKWVNDIRVVDLAFEEEEDQPERKFKDICELIEKSSILPGIKEMALDIFSIIAASEAKVHGIDPEDVHFHEVGAADSILDIVCISAAVKWFSPLRIYTRSVPVGKGFVSTAHGNMPVPAPATLELLKGMNVRFEDVDAELTTPTGAAVLQALSSKDAMPPDMVIDAVGYGCGDRELEAWPNLFRSIIAHVKSEDNALYVVETDIDDMIAEDWDSALDRILSSGALDANLTGKIMKKSRPGVGLKAIVPSENLHAVLDAVLTHTSSIGVRYYPVMRHVLERKHYKVKTPYGTIGVKEVVLPGGGRRIKPEYDDLERVSRDRGMSLSELRIEVERVIQKMQGEVE